MIHAVAAIADFMAMLLASALWVGAGIVGVGALGLGAVGGMVMAARRWLRPR